ncbi:MAG TPA: 50S ribosomal protein L6 [Dehalococcoidales bacterium]|nr:50S ribosomal protein L6 [Dehalococcoidales bacterium]
MSRVGKMPIGVPQGVSVIIDDSEVTVKGPNGELRRQFNPDMQIALGDNTLTVSRPSDDRVHRSLHGLTRSLLANMVEGVTSGFVRTLEIVGVGYRARMEGDNLVLNIGFSHTVEVAPLPGITLSVEGNNRMKVSGIDKEVVGEMAARIRRIRPPDSYKGKGIRYSGEVVRLKPGKAGKAIGR